jgi:hypothetical protein
MTMDGALVGCAGSREFADKAQDSVIAAVTSNIWSDYNHLGGGGGADQKEAGAGDDGAAPSANRLQGIMLEFEGAQVAVAKSGSFLVCACASPDAHLETLMGKVRSRRLVVVW